MNETPGFVLKIAQRRVDPKIYKYGHDATSGQLVLREPDRETVRSCFEVAYRRILPFRLPPHDILVPGKS